MDEEIKHKLDLFFSDFPLVSFHKNDSIIKASDPIINIFYLRKGLVRQYLLIEDGEDITLHLFRPTSYFPMMLAMSNVPNKYFFEAKSAVEVRKCPTHEVIAFVKREPAVLFDLATRFSNGLNSMLAKIENAMFTSAYKKVASLLLYLGTHFGSVKGENIVISLPLTHTDIASWTGLQRETVSRQLEKLRRKGIITTKNQEIIITDKHAFLNELQSAE